MGKKPSEADRAAASMARYNAAAQLLLDEHVDLVDQLATLQAAFDEEASRMMPVQTLTALRTRVNAIFESPISQLNAVTSDLSVLEARKASAANNKAERAAIAADNRKLQLASFEAMKFQQQLNSQAPFSQLAPSSIPIMYQPSIINTNRQDQDLGA